MSSIAPNTHRHAMNWKSGCAGRKSRGEHLRAGILRDWKFAQVMESGHANCLKICDAQKSNHPLLPLLCSSLPNLKLKMAALVKQWPYWTKRACCGLTQPC